MSPEMENDMAQGRYCKAGFWHGLRDRCDHIVATPAAPVRRPRPSLPAATTIPDDYYSEEATARRREENRQKYQPTRRPFVRNQELVGNEAKGLTDWR